MPSRSSLVLSRRNRRISERRARTSGVKRAGLGVGLILSILLIAGLVLGALAYADLTRGLPNVGILPALLNPLDGTLLRPTRLYDRTGKHLLFTFEPAAGGASTTAGGANIQSPAGTASAAPVLRRYLPLSASSPQHLPDFLAKATVVINDPGFWSHGGYTLAGMGDPGAHPTIAQKLVSDLLLYGEPPTLRRALRERILAAQLTAQYGRSQVLEWYLNSADYGNYAYGADAAAQLYFGKPATELTPAESAALAAASQAPGLNPLDAPALASQRDRTVIGLMKDFRVISAAEAQQAFGSELPASRQGAADHQQTSGSDYPLFTALALDQLSPAFTRDRITRGGLDIITTMDYDLQDGVQTQLAALSDGRSTASVVLDPQTGQILAATGETVRGEESPSLAPHDPGTLLTPFRYLTAFTRGFSPASLVWDIPSSASMAEPAAPGEAAAGSQVATALSNPQASSYHGPVRMRIALANDYAGAAQSVAAQMGTDAIARTESSFGLPDQGSQAGAGAENRQQPTLLELASAYAVFAADGVRYGNPEANAVLRVEGLDHTVWLDNSNPQAQAVVSQPLAYLINNVLSDEAARWPSLGHPNELEIGRPVGVKLGRSPSDAWAIGYTPTRLVALWADARPASLPAGQASVPAPDASGVNRQQTALLGSLLQLATGSLPADGWSAPAGIATVDVCDPSGLLPTKDCPSTTAEVFLSGNEPVQPDTLFRRYTVNRETGLLATVFTPPELVEEKVFMAVPPEAQEWAKSAGVPVAPSTFDAIQAPPVDPGLHFSAPTMFSDVSGKVQLRGTASGADFDHYRIVAGQGLNPQAWIVVVPDTSTRIEDGLLGTWDTSGLSGLYAVELQVVRSDNRIDSAILQVTVK